MKRAASHKLLPVYLITVLLVALGLRIWLFTTYPPVSYNDTYAYRRVAETVIDPSRPYDGTRTPGYPVFLAILGADRVVYAVQLVLGFLITLIFFGLGTLISGQPLFGALLALAHTLNPGQLLFEANLLSETLATFWVMLSILGSVWYHRDLKRRGWIGVAVGIISALAILTRPVFIFLPVLLTLYLIISVEGQKLVLHWRPVLTVLAVAVGIVVGWMAFMQSVHHTFSLTTMTGYHLVQHTGYYFEDVPDQYAQIRDIYLQYRDARIEARGTQGNAIWDAIPAIMTATGYSFGELSGLFQKISIQLILTHPLEYLARVGRGWWLFWRAPVYWQADAIASVGLRAVASNLILIARRFLFGANLFFILTSAAALISKPLRRLWSLAPIHWLLAGCVWVSSLVSSMLDHGDNPRFLIPLQSIVIFWFFWVIWMFWLALRKRTKTKEVEQPFKSEM